MFDQLRFVEPVSPGASPWLGLLAAEDSTVDSDGVLPHRVLVERIQAWGPSIEALTVLMAFEDHEVAGFGDYERVHYLKLLDAHTGWIEAARLKAISAVVDAATAAAAELTSTPGWDPLGLLGADPSADASEVGAALRLSPGTADRKVATAKAVTTRLPLTQASLEAGQHLAEDATWRRLVTDPVSGHLLDYGRTTYTPPRALSDYVMARDPRCVFPGCSLPAHANQIDHAVAWSAGGNTSADNLRPLSKRHHDDKTMRGWAYVINADGSVTWTSPTGHTYTVPPDPLLE